MTGLEKIIEEICNEAAMEAQSTIDKAKAEADDILEQAKAQIQTMETEFSKTADAEMTEIARSRESALNLQRRQMILATKQKVIAETLQKAQDTLVKLPEESYFKLITKLIHKAAQPQSGILILNESDKARLPVGFIDNLQLPEGGELTLSSDTQPISGGFILKYGDVMENFAFETLFNSRRGEFSDLAMKTMFDY